MMIPPPNLWDEAAYRLSTGQIFALEASAFRVRDRARSAVNGSLRVRLALTVILLLLPWLILPSVRELDCLPDPRFRYRLETPFM